MLDADFLTAFKHATEKTWSTKSINRGIYGFQIQPGTRWNPGLSDAQIAEYESRIGVRFPHDLRAFLTAMNGTDLPTLNVYASCGEPPRQSVGVYAYPRDIEIVEQRVADVLKKRAQVTVDLANQGFDLPAEAGLAPIYGHRYVMCSSDLERSVVLSICVDFVDGADAIVYGDSLQEYLVNEFLRGQL